LWRKTLNALPVLSAALRSLRKRRGRKHPKRKNKHRLSALLNHIFKYSAPNNSGGGIMNSKVLVLLFLIGAVSATATSMTAREALCPLITLVRQIGVFVAVVMLSYAGISFMTSGSDPMKHKEAEKRLEYVIIGILILIMAFYIVARMFSGVNVLSGGDCPWV
jgi:type IV secretory pathway VirB2 component (pilin)